MLARVGAVPGRTGVSALARCQRVVVSAWAPAAFALAAARLHGRWDSLNGGVSSVGAKH